MISFRRLIAEQTVENGTSMQKNLMIKINDNFIGTRKNNKKFLSETFLSEFDIINLINKLALTFLYFNREIMEKLDMLEMCF